LAIHGANLLRLGGVLGAFFVLVGLYEELRPRVMVQFTLAKLSASGPLRCCFRAFGFVHRSIRVRGKMAGGNSAHRPVLVPHSAAHWNLWFFAVGMHASFDFGEHFCIPCPTAATFPGHLSNATLAGPAWLTGEAAGRKPACAISSWLLIFFYVFQRLTRRATQNSLPGSV